MILVGDTLRMSASALTARFRPNSRCALSLRYSSCRFSSALRTTASSLCSASNVGYGVLIASHSPCGTGR